MNSKLKCSQSVVSCGQCIDATDIPYSMVSVYRLTTGAVEQPGIVTIVSLLYVALRSQPCVIALGNTCLPLCPLLTAQKPQKGSETSPLPPPPLLLHLQLLPPHLVGNTFFCLLQGNRISCVPSPVLQWRANPPQFLCQKPHPSLTLPLLPPVVFTSLLSHL